MSRKSDIMTIEKFHEKIKQYCDRLNGDCRKCCFLDYCYSQKRDIKADGEFLKQVVNLLSADEGNDKGIYGQVIHNPDNVYAP